MCFVCGALYLCGLTLAVGTLAASVVEARRQMILIILDEGILMRLREIGIRGLESDERCMLAV